MIKYIITGKNKFGERCNLFKNNRSYINLVTAQRVMRRQEEYYGDEIELKCEAVDVPTVEELLRYKKAYEILKNSHEHENARNGCRCSGHKAIEKAEAILRGG